MKHPTAAFFAWIAFWWLVWFGIAWTFRPSEAPLFDLLMFATIGWGMIGFFVGWIFWYGFHREEL